MTKIELKKSKLVFWLITLVVLLALVALIFYKQKKEQPAVNEMISPLTERAASFVTEAPPVLSAQDYVLGSAKAALKILVYEDYANVFSADNADNLDRIREEFGRSVSVIVRPYAVKEKADSLLAAMAIRCAGDKGEWERMRQEAFKILREGRLTKEAFIMAAQELKLPGEYFKTCLTDIEKQGTILQETVTAKDHSVYGAPTLFINNDLIVGARPYEDYVDSNGKEVEGLRTIVSQYLQ